MAPTEPGTRRLSRRRPCTSIAANSAPSPPELRAFLIESVSKTGGHLSSNLGTVELTIALHHVFNTPHDRIVWDVGHQTYGHKVLTGRREGDDRLRHAGGISGFPKSLRERVRHLRHRHLHLDLGRARHGRGGAHTRRGPPRDRGDRRRRDVGRHGLRGLNNAGDMENLNLLVILNDNEMSISPPVGALNQLLARLMSGSTYNTARRVGERCSASPAACRELARKVEEYAKGMVGPGTLFEEFGFHYSARSTATTSTPDPTLQNLVQAQTGPQFLHVITRKGQG